MHKYLITGGTGSFGNTFLNKIIDSDDYSEIRIFSRDEKKQDDLRKRIQKPKVKFYLGDVRDKDAVENVVKGVDYVFHAAALKQVPSCEFFPLEAIKTNILGTENVLSSAEKYNVKKAIILSTDKAAYPINVMGMTKALQERIMISGNITIPRTKFICVRYGNVIASRGSVIPLFKHQIEVGGPVTITVPEMTRFLLSLNQAVDTIFFAIEHGERGEIIVPNAPSVTVLNLAKALIAETDVDIKITGIRPGEKMHEIMVSDEECTMTQAKENYYSIKPMLPELFQGDLIPALNKEFSSEDKVLDLEGTHALLKKHNLLPGMEVNEESGEILI